MSIFVAIRTEIHDAIFIGSALALRFEVVLMKRPAWNTAIVTMAFHKLIVSRMRLLTFKEL